MLVQQLTAADYRTSTWSGGTTTELFIWPPDASYARRDFGFRISSARVDLAESDFTPLPGVERYITPLSGGFTLSHGDGVSVTMGPLAAPYRFSGGVATHCVGTATDMNLMLRGLQGEMTICRDIARIKPGFHGFYAVERGAFVLEDRRYPVEKGDFLGIFSDTEATLRLENTVAVACWAAI